MLTYIFNQLVFIFWIEKFFFSFLYLHARYRFVQKGEKKQTSKHPAVYLSLTKHMHRQKAERKRKRERENEKEKNLVSYLCMHVYISMYWEKGASKSSDQIDLMIMNLSIHPNRQLSLWNFITIEPLCVIIPHVFLLRPLRFLFDSYIKSAKVLVILLPRSIWNKGKLFLYDIYMCTSWLRFKFEQ